MAEKGKKKRKSGVEGDERFASVRFDPRFTSFPSKKKDKGRKKGKNLQVQQEDGHRAGKDSEKKNDLGPTDGIEEDPRFSDILKRDKRFAVGTAALRIDKRGRERQRPEVADGSASDSSTSESDGDGDLSDSTSSSFEDVIEEEEFKKKRIRAVERFGVGAFAGRYLEDDELEEKDLEGNVEYKKLIEGERHLLDGATTRIAVVDLDWQTFTACDILAVFRSFLPQGRAQSPADAVKRVTVYKSDYGIERMKIEDKEGPGVFLRNYGGQGGGSDDESASASEEEEEEREIDKDALRAYERSKLRYYFAIAEFGDEKIAKYLYDACDGLEFDRSSSRFDLRFVEAADGVEKDRPVRDESKDVPLGYTAPLDGQSFYNSAMQHTNVTFTWDQENKKRRNVFKEQFQKFKNSDAAMDADIQAYLASDSSSGEGDADSESEETKRSKFRSMLNLGGGGDGGSKEKTRGRAFASRDWGAEEDKDVDMVVTFDSGIDALGEKLKTKHDRMRTGQGDLTVWEQALEEKERKKHKRKASGEEDHGTDGGRDGDDGDGGFDDPFFEEASGKGSADPFEQPLDEDEGVDPILRERRKKMKTKAKGKQGAEELDLLLTSDVHLKALSSGATVSQLGPRGGEEEEGSYKDAKRTKKKKSKSKAKQKDGDFEMNLEDPRFARMFSSKAFALDPTEPQYKQVPEKLVEKYSKTKKVPESSRSVATTGHHDLNSAVESLKRKLKARASN